MHPFQQITSVVSENWTLTYIERRHPGKISLKTSIDAPAETDMVWLLLLLINIPPICSLLQVLPCQPFLIWGIILPNSVHMTLHLTYIYIYIYIYIVIHRQIYFVLSELISVARQYLPIAGIETRLIQTPSQSF